MVLHKLYSFLNKDIYELMMA